MKKIIMLLILTVSIIMISACSSNPLEGAVNVDGAKVTKIGFDQGIDIDGDYNTDMFYRNDKTIFNPDPSIMYVSKEMSEEYGGYYYMYLTAQTDVFDTISNIERSAFWVLKSNNLNNWEMVGNVNDGYAIATQYGDWQETRFWAPECYYNEADGKFYLYYNSASKIDKNNAYDYTNSEKIDNRYYIGISVSDNPAGPFEPVEGVNANGETLSRVNPQINFTKALNLNYDFSVLDVHLFDDNGQLYLYFVTQKFADRPDGEVAGNSIWVMEMKDFISPDYTTLTKILEPGYRTVTGTAGDLDSFVASGEFSTDQGTLEPLESDINEGPFVVKHNNKYYLTYSASGYTSKFYSVWQAVSDSPTGPFEKIDRNKGGMILGATPENDFATGTAHHSLTKIGDEMFIVYHAHASSLSYSDAEARAVMFDRVKFVANSDGLELLYANGPTVSLQQLPSAISGLKNVAKDAQITATNGSGTEYLNDDIIPTQTYVQDKEFCADGSVVINMVFKEAKEISSVMITNSMNINRAYSKVDYILFGLAGQTGVNTHAIICDLEYNMDYYNTIDGFMRAGGNSVVTFKSMKVNSISIKVSQKIQSKTDSKIAIGEIVVLGK